MKCLILNRKKLVIFLLFGAMFISCSDQNHSTTKNSKNEKLIDSLAIEKVEKTIEIKELNTELDSLKKIRDSLRTSSK